MLSCTCQEWKPCCVSVLPYKFGTAHKCCLLCWPSLNWILTQKWGILHNEKCICHVSIWYCANCTCRTITGSSNCNCTSIAIKLLMEQKTTPIDVQLDRIKVKQIEENKERLRPIVDAVILCGWKNIPFWGHRDDSKHAVEGTSNLGNFQEILKYSSRCAYTSNDELHKMVPKNATYKSKKLIVWYLQWDVDWKNHGWDKRSEDRFNTGITVADEATDFSNLEQMSVVIWFVDRTLTIHEEFLGFVPCELGLSGEAIATSIMKFVEQLGLNIQFCRGQGYDRAGNMAGRVSGAAARIQATNKNAIYVHCGSHILNLCIASSCQMYM